MIRRSEVEKHIPAAGRRYDVVVAGGGPAGLGAALAAGRMGANILLLEARSYFGSIAATSLFMPVNRLKTGGKTRGGVYEMLLPVGLGGLLVAGRCGYYTHQALAAGKSMGNMMAIGQAAGVAAAISAKEKVTPRELPASKVQKALLETLNARL